MENITKAQKKRIDITLERAINQGKLLDKSDAKVRINKHGNVWIEWKNTKGSFCFTVFQDGQIHSGLFGTEAHR